MHKNLDKWMMSSQKKLTHSKTPHYYNSKQKQKNLELLTETNNSTKSTNADTAIEIYHRRKKNVNHVIWKGSVHEKW